MKNKFVKGDILLIVDPQLDFMPNGSLAVPEGDHIITLVNQLISEAQKAEIPTIVSRDWHPTNHISFKEQGGPWPVHCVQNTKGAEFHPNIHLPKNIIIIDKAFESNNESYSALQGVSHTDRKPMLEILKELHTKRLWICGLAFDYCVLHSALDARKHHYETHVIEAATRGSAKETIEIARQDMLKSGVIID